MVYVVLCPILGGIMNNKIIKTIDEHNIDRDANVLFAFDLDGSEYVTYRIGRDEQSMSLEGLKRHYKDGVKYAHTIDPRTGYPVQHSLLSATVIADNCMRADALATAFMVLGADSAMAYCERHPEIKGYFIVAADSGKYEVLSTLEK